MDVAFPLFNTLLIFEKCCEYSHMDQSHVHLHGSISLHILSCMRILQWVDVAAAHVCGLVRHIKPAVGVSCGERLH